MLWLEYNEENIDTTLLEKLVWATRGAGAGALSLSRSLARSTDPAGGTAPIGPQPPFGHAHRSYPHIRCDS